MKIDVIIQARTGSTRLPGKTMMEIAGKPMLRYSVKRSGKAKNVDGVIVATTLKKEDDIISDFCKKNGITCVRGSEDDVLDRYYHAAKKYGSDVVVRITSDCPLIDSGIIDMVIQEFLKNKFDYVRTGKTFPNGIGSVEVFGFSTLEKIWKIAKNPGEREHVTPYIYMHPEEFKIKVIEYYQDCNHLVLSVDTKNQFDVVKQIIEDLIKKDENFGIDDILEYLKKHPEILNSLQGQERRGSEHYIINHKD